MSAGVWFDFFLTKPYERFSIQRAGADVQTTVLLALVAILVGEIALRRRKARAATSTARGEVLSLYVVAEMLAAGSKAAQVVPLVAEELRDLLFLIECRFDPDVHESRGPVLDRSGEPPLRKPQWDLDREGLPNRDVILPVEAGHHHLGSYLLRGPPWESPSPRTGAWPRWRCLTWPGAPSAGNPPATSPIRSRCHRPTERVGVTPVYIRQH